MKNKMFLVLLTAFTIGCSGSSAKPVIEKKVVHIVLCWLKDSGNAEQRQKIIETSRKFKDIPGVINVSVGEVIPSERKIVDDSFDVGILFTFVNTDNMNAYLVHPKHVEAVKSVLMPLLSKIVVYDYQE